MEATKYKVRAVKFQGKTKPIVCEKSNKCSALVALTNFLYLRRPEVAANHTLDTVEQNFLTSDIVSCIQKFYRRFYCPSYPRQEEDFVHLARSLHRQISLDPINSACNKFQRTIEYDLFTVLGVSLLHGWVLDPEDQNFKSLAGLPYSSMTVLSDLKTPSTNASDPAKSFMNASKHQITSFGLQQLHDKIAEKGLAVLYAGNECNLLYKHDGDLFTLEMSEDKLNQLPDGMWKKLAVEEDQSFYVTDDFGPTKGQHEEKYKLANEWFMAKLSSFDDDDKKPTRKKNRQKKKSTKALKGTAKDSTPQSIHISDVGQGSSKEAARLPSQLSSEEPSVSPTVAPPTTAEKFLNFLMQFQDQSGALYFESAVKEMICTSFLKLYVPFSLLQNHDGNLAIDIQDGYPRIHNELKQSVAKFIIKYDSSAATEEADLEIQNLPPPPKWNKKFLQFIEEEEMVSTYLLYDGTKDNTPTLTGNNMALGYLKQILDEFENLRGWSEVEKFEEGEQFTEGWSAKEMEVRNNATEFVITKKADVQLTKDVAVANLLTYVRHVFSCFVGTDPKRYPAYFDTFVSDILLCPEPKKGCLKWKRFLKYMRSPLALKVPLARSTLITEFYSVLSLELMLTPFDYPGLTRSGVRKDWREHVKAQKPFSHVYNFRIYSFWEASHWHVLQFSRHFVHHVLGYLKKMRFLHDIGIVELMVARRLEIFIADTIRTIVMEYGVDQLFSSAWGHFEGSNSTTMPLQHILQDTSPSNTTIEQIDELVIRLPPKKSGGHKHQVNFDITISKQKRVLHLLDVKTYLEHKDHHVEELGDGVVGQDCIQIRMTVNAEERKLAIQSPLCVECHTVLAHLHELLEGDNLE